MSAMAKFIGVECYPCRVAGHKCQAQMTGQVSAVWSNVPMCLRCANDEPCFAVTAELNFQAPARMLNDGYEGIIPRSTHSGSHGERTGLNA